ITISTGIRIQQKSLRLDQLARMGSRNRCKRYAFDAKCHCRFKPKLLIYAVETKKKEIMNQHIFIISKRVLAAITIAPFTFTTCKEDILDERPLDFLSPDNAYL